MKHGIQIKLPSFLLALAIVLSLCGCAVNPQELLNQLDLPQMSGKGKESEGEPPEKEATPSESTAPSESAGTQKPPEKIREPSRAMAAVRMIPTIWTRLSMLKQRKGKTL